MDGVARDIAEKIMKDIRENGESALLATAIRLGDIKVGTFILVFRSLIYEWKILTRSCLHVDMLTGWRAPHPHA